MSISALTCVGVDPALLAHALAHRGQLGRAEEEALEDELEDAPVVLGLGERRGQRLAEVGRLGPRDLARAPRTRRAARSSPRRRPRSAAPRRTRGCERRRGRRPGQAAGGRPDDLRGPPSFAADTLDHDVEVGAVLDDDRHRVVERLLVDVVGAEQQQRARPVDRLRDRRRLLQVEAADHRDDLDQPARRACRRSRASAASRSRARARARGSRATGTGSGASAPRSARACCSRSAARSAGSSPRRARAPGSRSGSPTGPRAAWPRTPGRSCRSRRSAGRPARARRSPSSAGARAGTPRRRCRPGRRPSRTSRSAWMRAAACGSSTRTAPWPRRGPRSTAGGSGSRSR